MQKIINLSAIAVITLCTVGVFMAFDINHHTTVVTDTVSADGSGGDGGGGDGGGGSSGGDGGGGDGGGGSSGGDGGGGDGDGGGGSSGGDGGCCGGDGGTGGGGGTGGDSGGGGGGGDPVTPLPVPTCVLNASTYTVEETRSVTISWSTADASFASLTGFGQVEGAGSRTFTASGVGTQTYTLSISGGGGSANCVITITVIPLPNPLPDCTLTAAPLSVLRGSNTVLSWTTTNADSAVISSGVGAVALGSGSREVTPAGTTNYILTVTKGAQTKNCPVTVTVTEQPPAPTCDSFVAAPTSIQRGSTTTLTWNTSNATSVSIDQGIGAVAVDGSRSVNPQSNTTYTLTASGNGTQVTCPVTVTVTEPPVDTPFTCANNVSFGANPSRIDEGQTSTLAWSVTGATSVAIDNGINTNNAMTGSVSVSPSSNTTFTLTAAKNGTTISCPVTITVDEDNGGGGGGGGSSTPRCELTASDKTIRSGERVTLTWDTSRATFVEIKDNRNKTVVTTDGKQGNAKEDLYDGSITVRPTRDTTYTLTAARGSRDRECTVKISVDDVQVTEVRDQQPLVTSISLGDVPYTGLDVRTSVQLTVLAIIIAWGVYLGYTFYRRDKVALKKA